MKLTTEQKEILESNGNLKINAVAGSGKTTTLIAYARSRPQSSKILYLAFNRSVKVEAAQKFADQGLGNVKVETAHSLAYQHMLRGRKIQITPGLTSHELKLALKLRGFRDKHTPFILANHVNKFAAYFCNSTARRVQDLNYANIVQDEQAKGFVKQYYPQIEKYTRRYLAMMYDGSLPITHDFYLKQFQLSEPNLPYDYVLFDEGQDASPAMLGVFIHQGSTKVIVGDTHQQIYGWRHAVNSLEQVDYPEYQLSSSFRFDAEVASLANRVLNWKGLFTDYKAINITGHGQNDGTELFATIARTNMALLNTAIQQLIEEQNIQSLYFEGNIQSYTYADEGASVYDVLNLYNGRQDQVRDQLIKSMASFDELEEYIEQTGDVTLGMLAEIVKKYGRELPNLVKQLKQAHVADGQKGTANMVFSTVHRCKGMEYDHVTLTNDFITEDKIKKVVAEVQKEELNTAKMNEEVNLLYVAVTRTRNQLKLPEELMPASKITLINQQGPEAEKTTQHTGSKPYAQAPLINYVEDNASEYLSEQFSTKSSRNQYKRWATEDDELLTTLYCEGKDIEEMMHALKRKKGAILSRVRKLELREKYGDTMDYGY